jgi:hypothetical protein
MRRLLLVVVLAAAVVPAALAGPAAKAPGVSMRATFQENLFKTDYRIVITRAGGRTIGNVVWTFKKPPQEPGCTQFSSHRLNASWLHGDQHGCDHTAMGPRGHAGVIGAKFTLGNLTCRVSFSGSETDVSRGRCRV